MAWGKRLSRGPSFRPRGNWTYAVAISLPLLALVPQHYIYTRLDTTPSPFLLEYPTVFFVVWLGGLIPGLLATLVGALGLWFHFLPPYDSFAIPSLPDLLKLTVFVAISGLFSIWVPRAQRRLQELDQDFLTLLEHTSDFIYFKDQNNRLRFCSQAMARLCGYDDWHAMIGMHDFEIFPPETARIYAEEEIPVFRDGQPLLDKVDPYITPGGEWRWVSSNRWPVLAADGKTVVGLFGISHDITERKAAEDALQSQALKSEMLLRASGDGIHILDAKGNVLQVNDAFCRMLGYSREEALRLNVRQWDARWTDQEIQTEILPRVLQNPMVFETKHRRRDGRLIDVEVSASTVDIGGEKMIFSASRDITERKRAETSLQRAAAELAEAGRLKDIFTDVLRHDLLTPLTAIKIATEVLLKRETDRQKTEILKKVQQSAQNLEEMTVNAARLASVSANQVPEFVVANPAEVLRSVLPDLDHKLAEKNMILVDHSCAGFSAWINPMIKDVFANLLSNAIKYSPPETQIDVCVDDRDPEWIFYVKDQGTGVPDEHKQSIFKRFERLGKEGVKGSGLGLTIAQQIVRLHGGEIWVEDNPAGGSIFFVRLPKTPPKVPQGAEPYEGVPSSETRSASTMAETPWAD